MAEAASAAMSGSRWTRLPLVGNLGYPIALKEVRSLIRGGRYFWAQFFYLAVLAVGVVIIITVSQNANTLPEEITREVFTGFFLIQNFLVYLIFPAFAATCVSGERVEKSYDLLITTDLSAAEIVWGKFIGVFGGCCYFLLVTLPILGICILFGGVSYMEALENYIFLLFQAALVTIWGVFISCASSTNIRAILGTYSVAFLIGFFVIASVEEFLSGGTSLSLIDLPAGTPDSTRTIIYLAVGYFVITFFLLCFLAAVQRLMSQESNRSTMMRVFVLVALLVALALFGYFAIVMTTSGLLKTPKQNLEYLSTAGIIMAVALFLVVLLVGGDRVETPLRVVREAGRKPLLHRIFWLFLPGGCRGVIFALLILAVGLLGLEWLGGTVLGLQNYGLGPGPTFPTGDALSSARVVWSAIGAGFFAYAALAFLISALGVRGILNLAIVVGCAILATCYSATYFAMDVEPRWYHLYPLSLMVSLHQFWEMNAIVLVDGPAAARNCIITHIAVGAVLSGLACVTLRMRGVPVFKLQRSRVQA